jgi:myo-inositol 2-dehydrogenase / D-chiro-inositol 1-dehydrogenase
MQVFIMSKPTVNRRGFLATSAVAATAASSIASVHAAGNDTLRIALVGCGGRGTGAAGNALQADKNVKLVAMADVFDDQIKTSLDSLKQQFPDKVAVTPDTCFVGFEAYKQAIDAADVVVLGSTPGFRPQHFAYAVEKGKHVFMEKPHATDVAGALKVIETAKLAQQKKLCVVSGFCYRYDNFKRETVKRIHGGQIGEVHAIHTTFLTGELWDRSGKAKKVDPAMMDYQLRMWYYFTWLSGDFIIEQAIHNIDKAAWVMNGELPISAIGTGGRISRVNPKFGNIWDNFSIVYEYKSGAKVFLQCRQINGCVSDNNDHIMGTKGVCHLMKHTIKSEAGTWKPEGEHDFGRMYQQEHNELFAAIRAGKVINDAVTSGQSTLMGVLGREAAYTGQRITWDRMLKSQQNLMPKEYTWGENPQPVVPVPGKYKFV